MHCASVSDVALGFDAMGMKRIVFFSHCNLPSQTCIYLEAATFFLKVLKILKN